MELRDYQKEAVTAIWNEINREQTALCVLSTGAGKSIIMAELLKISIKAKPDIKCLVLFNKLTLIKQLSERIADYVGKEKVGIYCSGLNEKDLSKTVTVASVQSLPRDLDKFNLLVVDECHNVNEKLGRYKGIIEKQLALSPRIRMVGFTATPWRHDGYIYGRGRIFSKACYERGLKYFIDKGYLVTPIAKQPEHQMDLSGLRIKNGDFVQEDIDKITLDEGRTKLQVQDALPRMVGRKKIVWFCSSIKHAEMIKDILSSHGELVTCLHSNLSDEQRNAAQSSFETGFARHLTFVTIVSEGYDYPAIDCVVLMRPTRSAGLMVQTCGRGLRLAPGKDDCLILDYGNVISTLGPLEDPVIKNKAKGLTVNVSQKVCQQCFAYVPVQTQFCPHCEYKFFDREVTKNLNLTADENIHLLTKKIHQIEISQVKVNMHKSKAENLSFRITYFPKGILQEPVSEFFRCDLEWSYKKFQARALDLGMRLVADPYEQVTQQIRTVPKRINYVMENKYPKVKSLEF